MNVFKLFIAETNIVCISHVVSRSLVPRDMHQSLPHLLTVFGARPSVCACCVCVCGRADRRPPVGRGFAEDAAFVSRGVTALFSGPGSPGEGEHKIMDFIRARRFHPGTPARPA